MTFDILKMSGSSQLKNVVVFEFKFNKKVSDALAQIHRKKYVDKYKTSGKKNVLAGVNFKNNDHEIGVEWLIEY